jgi:hypothetical protein
LAAPISLPRNQRARLRVLGWRLFDFAHHAFLGEVRHGPHHRDAITGSAIAMATRVSILDSHSHLTTR